jgi:hypothetical protein
MDPVMLTWLLIILGVVVIVATVLLVVLNRQPANVRALTQTWREVSRRTPLVFTPPEESLESARLHGVFRNREVAAAVRMRMAYGAGGQETHYYTRLEAYVSNPRRSFMRVNSKGRYRKTDQYLGQPFRPLGDARFDALFDLKCIPHDLAESLIPRRKALRDGLLALHRDHYVELELDGNTVRFEEGGLVTNADYLLALANLLCDFGEAFEQLSD